MDGILVLAHFLLKKNEISIPSRSKCYGSYSKSPIATIRDMAYMKYSSYYYSGFGCYDAAFEVLIEGV